MNQTLRYLRRALVVAGLAGAGVTLWPSASQDPATATEKRAVLAKLRCNGDDCYAGTRCARMVASGASTDVQVERITR